MIKSNGAHRGIKISSFSQFTSAWASLWVEVSWAGILFLWAFNFSFSLGSPKNLGTRECPSDRAFTREWVHRKSARFGVAPLPPDFPAIFRAATLPNLGARFSKG